MFTIATHGAPGRPNEDYVVATPELAVIVDGAGIPFGGCSHGVAWYARHLATHTAAAVVAHAEISLRDGLAAGIAAVAALHSDTCDLTSASTPCAAVGILRIGDAAVDTLALSDVTVVVETAEGIPHITCDLAIEDLAGTEPDTLRNLQIGSPDHGAALRALVDRQTKTRNRDDGWWVAAADPAAAQHAVTNTYPRADVRRAAVLSDGATRPVDQMDLYKWPEYLNLLDELGPVGLIEHVRRIEREDPVGVVHARTKIHDDASVALLLR